MLNEEPYDGKLRIAIHDLSTNPSSRIVTDNFDLVYGAQFNININQNNPWIGLYVHVSDGNGRYSGGNTIYAYVKQGSNELNLEVKLSEVVSLPVEQSDISASSEGNLLERDLTDYDDIEYNYTWLPAGEIHSISGITVNWVVETTPYRTVLYYQSYEKSVYYNNYPTLHYVGETDWSDTGKMPCQSYVGTYVSASNGAKKVVEANVKYGCEEWWYGPDIGNPYVEEYYYFMKPVRFESIRLGSDISCGDCASTHPAYGNLWSSGQANPFEYAFDSDGDDNTQWKVASVSFSFGFTLRDINFGASISLYLAGGDETTGIPPYLSITVNSGSTLYYWFDDDDPTSYIAHFSRT